MLKALTVRCWFASWTSRQGHRLMTYANTERRLNRSVPVRSQSLRPLAAGTLPKCQPNPPKFIELSENGVGGLM